MRQSVETAPPAAPTTMDISGGANQVGVRSFAEKEPTLEDVFMLVTKGLVT